jgi:hypothetical protein
VRSAESAVSAARAEWLSSKDALDDLALLRGRGGFAIRGRWFAFR